MSDVTMNAPLDEVRGLVEERERYEGWLLALDARRAVTPAHVLDRVRQDYDGRLHRVLDALDAHSGALRADEAALAGHHDEQLRTLGERRDQLAEVELRTLVGEYAPEEGERQRHEVEGAIGELEGRLAGVASQLADVRGLLGRVARDGANANTPPRDTPPASEEGTPQTAPGSSLTGGSPPASGSATDDRLGLEAARAALGDADVHGYTPNHYAPGIRTGTTRSTPPFAGQSFADSAFRTPSSMPAQTAADAAMPTPGMGSGFGTPATSTGSVTQDKTLRCADCGAMNYPTEWYCEKCGGELAAL